MLPASAPGRGRRDGQVLDAVLAGLEGQRIELRRGAAPGPGARRVAAAIEVGQIVRQPGDRHRAQRVVAIGRRNRGAERHHATLLGGAGRYRATKHRAFRTGLTVSV